MAVLHDKIGIGKGTGLYRGGLWEAVDIRGIMVMRKATIHYAATNKAPDPRWRERQGVILVMGKGGGPKNVLVSTDIGLVVVPRGNVRFNYEPTRTLFP